ncbi:DUF2062 domain-containing protein [Sulfitobacter sp. F26204]|uniref:DUF2062 domain-containing protein n=1 Tax=Sulfitobacter sp. F26204 TaxID=2996014 RepID=UPI00225DF0A6|nr:DUF2062 domain-containing protein [Sulfitobacter sp. F26204]MCX7558649.1 DUF2062 domain-containing protein [Sulfitobacter sp. F26204]
MIFKRRDPKPTLRAMAEFLWPRGGWARAFHYVKHRMRRLPDSPERIARGVWAGVFITFTPLFGFHFVAAVILAKIMKGNIVASLMATFVGNPLTFVFIALSSLKTGHLILGTELQEGELRALSRKFANAGGDLWHNFVSIFTPDEMDWSGLAIFSREVFYPYLIGGIIPGIICATIAYYLAVPLLHAYQKRRRGLIKAKFEALKQKAAAKADAKRRVDEAK